MCMCVRVTVAIPSPIPTPQSRVVSNLIHVMNGAPDRLREVDKFSTLAVVRDLPQWNPTLSRRSLEDRVTLSPMWSL